MANSENILTLCIFSPKDGSTDKPALEPEQDRALATFSKYK